MSIAHLNHHARRLRSLYIGGGGVEDLRTDRDFSERAREFELEEGGCTILPLEVGGSRSRSGLVTPTWHFTSRRPEVRMGMRTERRFRAGYNVRKEPDRERHINIDTYS